MAKNRLLILSKSKAHRENFSVDLAFLRIKILSADELKQYAQEMDHQLFPYEND